MPEKETVKRAKQDKRKGRAPSTQAGEFVHEEIEHIRKGKHGARSTKQAIAIGLSKARRAGVKLATPKAGRASAETRRRAAKDSEAGQKRQHTPSPARSRATRRALKREGSAAASHAGLSRQAKASARSRTAANRSQAARKAVKTKGSAELKTAAKKAARTRSAGGH